MGRQIRRWLTVLGAVCLLAIALIGVRWLKAPAAPAAATVSNKPGPVAAKPVGAGASIIAGALDRNVNNQYTGDGLALYMAHCASCHGANLQGQADWQTPNPDGSLKAPPHDDSGHTWHHEDELLFNYTKLGGSALMAQAGIDNFNSAMPGFAKILSDDQIHQILNFIKSRWSIASRKAQRERTAAWKQMTRQQPKK